MFDFFKTPEQMRQKHERQAKHPLMQVYYSHPFVAQDTPWDEMELVSLDFETSGLDPRRDHILSYGKVNINHGAITLRSARHEIVYTPKALPEASVVVHHITDDQVENARNLEQVLPNILAELAGKVLLVHFQQIELGFMNAACKRLYGSPFLIPTIDTLLLAERLLTMRNHALSPSQLRLFNLRQLYKLPAYKAHDALYDAMTTAELFMALVGEISPHQPSRLKALLR